MRIRFRPNNLGESVKCVTRGKVEFYCKCPSCRLERKNCKINVSRLARRALRQIDPMEIDQ